MIVSSLVLMVSGGFLGLRVLFSSDYFRLDSVQVVDAERVSHDEILALSDIQNGTCIFDLDLERIGRKIEEDPWIARAQVESYNFV